MKGTAKRKVVTSGRLTGGAKVQPARRPAAPGPAPASCPQPAYSLYSTDSEDQVGTLNKGLDRCAALLSGILQAEKAASPSVPRAPMGGVTKSRQSTSLGKKTIKKVQRSAPPGRGGPGAATPRTTHRTATPAAHSGVKLHPPPPPTSSTPLQPQTSVLLSAVRPSSHSGQPSHSPPTPAVTRRDAERDAEEDELVDGCTTKMSDMQLAAGGSAETDVKTRTVHNLLEELKTLVAGQGSVAEMLLSHLEQTVSSPHMNGGGPMARTVPDLSSLHGQNSQLRRCVTSLKQQLKEKEDAERQRDMEVFPNPQASTLQEELTCAQARLQELRRDLQDTQSQLREREAENVAVKTELEATRRRLSDSERQRSALAAVAQQRLEEMENLNRILRSRDSSHPAAPADHITQYLRSLEQLSPTERVGGDVGSQRADGPALAPDSRLGRPLWMASRCDAESEWSVTTGSTFDTRDEAAFRDGLAALDASIASLQKTIQLDLRR